MSGNDEVDRLHVWAEGTAFETGTQRGIHRYCLEVFGRAARSFDVTVQMSAPVVMPFPAGCQARVAGGPVGRLSVVGRAARHWRRSAHRRASRAADLFHSTYFAPAPPGLSSVVTVYDMIPELHPDLFLGIDAFVEQKRAVLEAATRIVTISADAAAALAECYPSMAAKVAPIHLGADHFPTMTAAPGADDYVVYVGDRLLYKNFRTLVEAVATPQWTPGLTLKVVGRPFSPTEAMLIRRLRVEGRIRHLGRLSDEALATVYASATALVFPSIAEGFGLPLVEAQRCGCPVACSDIPVFREVAAAAAVYFDARDPMSMATAVGRCLDPALRDQLVSAGTANARRFTWEACARRTMDVYRDAARRPSRPADT